MNKQKLIDIFNENLPNTPMSEQEIEIAINLMMSKDENLNKDLNELDKESEIYKHFKPLINGFQMQIFLKRLEHMAGLKITLGAFIMIAQHLNSAGEAVMYAYYLFYKLPANILIGTDEVSIKLFPWGFFSEEQLRNIWDKQKVRPDDGLDELTCYGTHDNLLDYFEYWNKEYIK